MSPSGGPGSNVPREGEFDLIRWIRDHTPVGPSSVLGIGDDAAVLRLTQDSGLVATTDMLMDGRHFHLDLAGAEAVGYKSMAVNVSDVAAMAARPVAALVAVALPRRNAGPIARGLHTGMARAAEDFGFSIVGGDTNAWDGPLVICVTLLGETVGRGPVPRSGAREGDIILVTGPLGGSLKGRHLKPVPRVLEALALNQAVEVHALIDVSDGLASDLGHILEESGNLGALLEEGMIPLHPDAVELSRLDGRPPIEHALHDGEDFELCVVMAQPDAERLLAQPLSGVTLHQVGQVVSMPGIWVRDGAGKTRIIEPAGFDHLR